MTHFTIWSVEHGLIPELSVNSDYGAIGKAGPKSIQSEQEWE